MKIRTRFTLLFALIVGIILVFFSIAIYSLSENYRSTDFHSRLQDRSTAKLKYILSQSDQDNLPISLFDSNSSYTISDEKLLVFKQSKLIFREGTNLQIGESEITSISIDKISIFNFDSLLFIGFNYNYEGENYTLFASAKDDFGERFMINLENTLIVRGVIIMFIIVFTGWFYVGRLLKPISNIVEEADKITLSNLNFRLKPVKRKDEIGRLTSTINNMLERLEKAFKIQKRFVSNASHEIRNPLTAMSGQIDVALMRDRSGEEYKRILQSVSHEIKNVRTLSNNLLELANSEVETLFQEMEPVRIDEVLWDIREEFLKLKPEYKMQIHFDEIIENEQFLTCKGKERLLQIAFMNIIDNACKFSENNTVNIRVTNDKANISLFFEDQGKGIPKEFLSQIFEPFARGKNTHGIPGSGIGLSLVHRIVKLHSGKIFIESELEKGTNVEIVLPVY